MKIDNIDKIKKLLSFGQDTYYFAQIIKRRKDPGNSEMSRSELRLWLKYLTRPETLDKVREEIKELCEFYNARCYIDLNPRNLKLWSIELGKRLLDRIAVDDFTNIHNLPNKIALSESTICTRKIDSVNGRRWMFDIDQKEDIPIVSSWIKEKKINIISEIPTISGEHIIVESFDYKKLGLSFENEFQIGDSTITHLSPSANTLLYF